MSGRLEGRVAVVTGAGQGLGRAIAEVFAGEGASVALLGRTRRTLEDAASSVADRGGRAHVEVCDVSDRAQTERAVASVLDVFGGVDALVNNAQGGNMTKYVPTAKVDDESGLESFRTGPLGALHMMQACFEPLRDSGHGSVINFGSGIGVRGAPGMVSYAMAKEAMGGLTKVAANEWGKHQIRVNLVCPAGWSPAAERYRDEFPRQWEQARRTTPLRRLGDPHDDIARAVMALVTDDMQYLTGATLMLDGGQVVLR
ncbi:SDR family NAD(P)-dependent oxidoreductase [Parafrankia sp. FMc2]|uniref:SDR family NAD(P)-dependent oxidoreductase n=1 Tax=Parafrankia sp. FMc2 TaxID=3233196 RepID=UPI0034D6B6D6